jgi:hypothetical protein
MMITKTSSDNIEHESLPTHVELSAQRMASIHSRMSEIEVKQDKLEMAMTTLKFLVIKSIGVATAVLTSAVSLTVIILDRLR